VMGYTYLAQGFPPRDLGETLKEYCLVWMAYSTEPRRTSTDTEGWHCNYISSALYSNWRPRCYGMHLRLCICRLDYTRSHGHPRCGNTILFTNHKYCPRAHGRGTLHTQICASESLAADQNGVGADGVALPTCCSTPGTRSSSRSSTPLRLPVRVRSNYMPVPSDSPGIRPDLLRAILAGWNVERDDPRCVCMRIPFGQTTDFEYLYQLDQQ
jgi:hypothetical protein